MWRNVASNAMTFFVVLFVVLGGVIALGQNNYVAEGPLTQAICLRVAPGSNMKKVSINLADSGAISSAALFRVGAKYSDKTQLLKAGSFLVPEGASMAEIVEMVTRSGQNTCGTEIVYRIGIRRTQLQVRDLDPATNKYVEIVAFNPVEEDAPAAYLDMRERGDMQYRVVMAEGVTSWQVAQALKAADFLDGVLAEVPAEGSLAPDSYEMTEGTSIESVVASMTAAQTRILQTAWDNRAAGLPLKDMAEALVLASIVEKETGVAAERRQVASVFINRLNQGIKLQTDPTVIYGITNGQGILGRGLRQSELRRETAYNTYVIKGLPPGPIANPGRLAIEAALNPDDTPYIFFVADGTGGHAFAVTLREHNANVTRWRAIEAGRSGN